MPLNPQASEFTLNHSAAAFVPGGGRGGQGGGRGGGAGDGCLQARRPQQQQQPQGGLQHNNKGGNAQRGGHACGSQNSGPPQQRMPQQAQVHPALARPQPPVQQQQQHGAPASYQGFDPSLSLAQALGQVLEGYSDTLATEPDIAAKMRLHPQGANWRSCLEVMVEQSVRHGALHPECPDIRQSVHCAAVRGVDGSVSQLIMVSHPAAAPFNYYCECIEILSKCLVAFLPLSLSKHVDRGGFWRKPYLLTRWCSLRRSQQAGGRPAVSAGVLAADAC